MGDIHAFTLYTYHGEAFKSSLYCACTLDMYTYYRKSYYIHGIGSLVTYKMECNVITCEDNEIMRPWCGMDRNAETSSLWFFDVVNWFPGCLKDMMRVGIKKKIDDSLWLLYACASCQWILKSKSDAVSEQITPLCVTPELENVAQMHQLFCLFNWKCSS